MLYCRSSIREVPLNTCCAETLWESLHILRLPLHWSTCQFQNKGFFPANLKCPCLYAAEDKKQNPAVSAGCSVGINPKYDKVWYYTIQYFWDAIQVTGNSSAAMLLSQSGPFFAYVLIFLLWWNDEVDVILTYRAVDLMTEGANKTRCKNIMVFGLCLTYLVYI